MLLKVELENLSYKVLLAQMFKLQEDLCLRFKRNSMMRTLHLDIISQGLKS